MLRARFSRKMSLAFAIMIIVLVALAWLFWETTRRYEYHLKRSELAHGVFESYLAVSNHTFRKLNAMGEISFRNRVEDSQARFTNEQSLRKAMGLVRQRIAAELAFVKEEHPGEELEYLVEIERLVEKIIQASERIKQAARRGDSAVAQQELSTLRSDAIAGRFNELIDLALAKESKIVAETDQAAHEISVLVTRVLPAVILLVVILMILGILFLSRRLTHSLKALYQGAQSLGSGNLDHRIDPLVEIEFDQVATAFNAMAKEITANRQELEHAKGLLEAKVIERTRELEKSNARLARSDQSRRRFLADISHELRTPLTVIRGESEITLRGAHRDVEEYRESLNRILDQAVHTSRLVDDLLFVARADAGAPRLTMKPVAMKEIVQSVCSDMRTVAKEEGVTLSESLGDLALMVVGDAGRLRQVLVILIDNALSYTQNGGTVNVLMTEDESWLTIQVRDDGMGITKEDAELAFQRFYRGAKASHRTEGLGLGLPVAKAIVEAHQGRIFLDGVPGKGTEATVMLPRNTAAGA